MLFIEVVRFLTKGALEQAFFWPFQKNSSPKKLKDSKKTQANFPKTQGSANSEDRLSPNFWTVLNQQCAFNFFRLFLRLNSAM